MNANRITYPKVNLRSNKPYLWVGIITYHSFDIVEAWFSELLDVVEPWRLDPLLEFLEVVEAWRLDLLLKLLELDFELLALLFELLELVFECK